MNDTAETTIEHGLNTVYIWQIGHEIQIQLEVNGILMGWAGRNDYFLAYDGLSFKSDYIAFLELVNPELAVKVEKSMRELTGKSWN